MERKFGILLPVFSLYGEYGIGTFGKPALEFIDLLSDAGVSYWQVLPLCPVDSSGSPYSSSCSLSLSPLYIDPEVLFCEGLLTFEECRAAKLPSGRVNHSLLKGRIDLFKRAFSRFRGDVPHSEYSIFFALRESGTHLRCRYDETDEFVRTNGESVRFWDFVFYEATRQWQNLRSYANKRGVSVIGDIPFYVAEDSFEVWNDGELFDFELVAGVPPDYFSETGQKWGNPVYKFGNERTTKWWSDRITGALKLYDVLRLDHFRAFDEFYAIPKGREDAVVGSWRSGPGKKFFEDKRGLPIIAEDLGTITPSLRELIDYTGYPGMRVLQFGLGGGADNPHAIENINENCVCYTGTHDNMPLMTFIERSREKVYEAVGCCDDGEAADRLMELYGASKAKLFIVPLFDLMHKGESYRINTPSTISEYNWSVRIKSSDLYGLDAKIGRLIQRCGRK